MTNVVMLDQFSQKFEYSGRKLNVLDTIATALLHLGDKSLINSLYVQSGPAANGSPDILGDNCRREAEVLCRGLADYEYGLLSHIRKSTKRAFFLLGPPGSGKSTTLQYLFNNFVFTNALQHCNWSGCNKECRLVSIDFDHDKYRKIKSTSAAKELLIEEFSSRLNLTFHPAGGSAVNPQSVLSKEDLDRYWEWVKTKMGSTHAVDIPGLRKIAHAANLLNINISSPNSHSEIRAQLAKDSSEWLDYLFCVCQFLCTEKYNPKRPCLYIVLDNIDYASASVQEELVHLLATRTKELDLNIVVGLREETFYRHFIGNLPFEFKKHNTAGAVPVLKRRYDVFLKSYSNAQSLLSAFPMLQSLEFSTKVHHHLKLVSAALDTYLDKPSVLVTFINSALNHFVRSSLLGTQYLIYGREDFISASGKTQHHLLRAFLRYTRDHFGNEYNAPVCNLFHTRVEFTNYALLKLRILQYLWRIPAFDDQKHERNSIVVSHLRRFNYPDAAIENALDDMASPYHQLIFGLDTDWLSENSDSIMSRIYLSKGGGEYLRRVVYSLDYIGEMIVSCAVPEEHYYGLASSDFVVERMHAVVRFLKSLVDDEMAEQVEWIRNSMGEGRDKESAKVKAEYVDAYGRPLLSYRLLLFCSGQLRRIARASCRNDTTLEADFMEVFKDYKDALVRAGNENDKFEMEFGSGRKNKLNEIYNQVLKNVDIVIAEGVTTSRWKLTGFDKAGHLGVMD